MRSVFLSFCLFWVLLHSPHASSQGRQLQTPPIVVNVPKQDPPVVNVSPAHPVVNVEGDAHWAQWAQGLGAIVAALAGLIAVWIAKRALAHSDAAAKAAQESVAEMRAQARNDSRAEVIAYLDIEPTKPLFYFVVKNLGRSPARNVRLKSDAVFPRTLPEGALWVEGEFPLLAPGQTLRSLMSSSFDILDSEGADPWPRAFTTRVTFDDGVDTGVTREFQLSFEAFEGIIYTNSDMDDMKKAMQDIAKSISHFHLRPEVESYIWKFWQEFLQLHPEVTKEEVDGKSIYRVQLGEEWPPPMMRASAQRREERQQRWDREADVQSSSADGETQSVEPKRDGNDC